MLAQSNETDRAEAAYRRAIQIVQKQQAKLFELRATTSLAQLWLRQGRNAGSRKVLGRAFGLFTEGLDTRDLKVARALIEFSGIRRREHISCASPCTW